MTVGIILTLCILVLLAYVFDFTSSKTKIPSVILLLALGYLVRQLCNFFDVNLLNLETILPVLGTIGLILIVLEGSFELELNKTKLPLVRRSVIMACIPVFVFSFGFATFLSLMEGYTFKTCLTNAIPLSIISSSIAIPSVRNYNAADKEFVIYESSISDIIGVIFFNFVALHTSYGFLAFGLFLVQLFFIVIVSFLATGGLSFLLSRIDHHIKFVPIIFLVILIYEISKIFNLPSLVFILVFGLFLNNLNELRTIHWIQFLRPKLLRREVHKFKEIIIEGTFLVRVLFFMVFGYSIQTGELLNLDSLVWALGITAAIFLIRWATLRLCGEKSKSLVFIAPRGLITILLFLSVKAPYQLPVINRSMIIQVIILSALVLMAGSLLSKRKDPAEELPGTVPPGKA